MGSDYDEVKPTHSWCVSRNSSAIRTLWAA
jgi:hypothetical protein